MHSLLPHSFKRAGWIIAPIGAVMWLLMQTGKIQATLVWALGPGASSPEYPPYHAAEVTVAILGFFSFLIGLYFISFSKEAIEDEMIRAIRLNSLMFAALVQLISIIISFTLMMVLGEPDEGGMMLFLIVSLLLFWVAYIAKFHFTLLFGRH